MTFALLAPVPAMFLKDAQSTCEKEGKVAFGTNVTDLFLDLDKDCDVFIYPSSVQNDPDKLQSAGFVSFRAIYDGFVFAENNGHHKNPKIRPPRVFDPSNPDTAWTAFWEVRALQRLPRDEWISINKITAANKQKAFPKSFILHGPIKIKHPL
jgi:hypothetical protein